jgi:hypothetical protein
MSDYLIHELDRYGVAARDSSEIAGLHGTEGVLEAVTLTSERLRLSFLFLFLGAQPCTEWLVLVDASHVYRDGEGDFVAREESAQASASHPTGGTAPPPRSLSRSQRAVTTERGLLLGGSRSSRLTRIWRIEGAIGDRGWVLLWLHGAYRR